MSRIAVIGTGYVGLTTGAYLASLGHTVTCVDVVPEKVEMLQRGEIPIFEAGLPELVRAGLDAGALSFSLDREVAVKGAEFVFLCVQTPQGDDGAADLSYIRVAAEQLGPLLDTDSIVINKSTVPVGSTRMVERALGRGDVHVVSNPEFLREGSAVHDSFNPDRIVIGADDTAAASRVAALYDRIKAPLLVTDPASAELIKYASNAFLATKISYINAVANLCEAVGADVKEVVLGMGYDKRIGFEFLRPGPGWGGSCFHPDETLLVRRYDDVRLLTFEELFAEVERLGHDGWEALSWDPLGTEAEFRPVAAFTARPYTGQIVKVKTKMGRRLTVTDDHPFVVGDGGSPPTIGVKSAAGITTSDWLPVSTGSADLGWDEQIALPLLSADAGGIDPGQLIVRCGPHLRAELTARRGELHHSRRRDVLRSGALRLAELKALGIHLLDDEEQRQASVSTVTNGTYVPTRIPMDEDFWRMIGLYLAEGAIASDGKRVRISWYFHPTDEDELVEFVRGYWDALGVRASVFQKPTSRVVTVSSRVLAAWLEHSMRVGRTCYDKRIPDSAWSATAGCKAALLRGLWDGDGSWSLVAGGPSVVLEYGTVSRRLVDGMLRLLGDLGIVARLKVGRGRKSTVDTYWLSISGADQIEDCLWLFPPDEQDMVQETIGLRQKRIAPTGYRRAKNAAWVRVTDAEPSWYEGTVYSLEVPGTHTVVTTHGLIVHNCFPKDTNALVRIADDAGYDFGLLEGVIEVNVEQYDRMVAKIASAVGGALDGKTVAVWGLTFKALTDDLRDSPALAIIQKLIDRGAAVRAYDPMVPPSRRDARVDNITVCPDAYDACTGAEVLVVLTEWDEFRWLDFDKVADQLAVPTVVDCRNLLDPSPLRRRGFSYVGVGRL